VAQKSELMLEVVLACKLVPSSTFAIRGKKEDGKSSPSIGLPFTSPQRKTELPKRLKRNAALNSQSFKVP
jgi:hypothetical protein